MDVPEALSPRARRALPLMAGALAAIVVAGLVHLHPSFPSSTKTSVARAVSSPPVLSAPYSATFDFVTPSTGWALVVDNLNGPQHVYVFRTTDGAKHWQKQFAGSSPQAVQPTVYSSVDGGATWQPHVLPTPTPAPGGKPLPPQGMRAFTTTVRLLPGAGVVAFVDSYTQSGAFTSFDGGKSWRALARQPEEISYSDFVYQDSTHWWAMRFGTLWKSSDAGQSWKHVGQLLDDWDYRPHVIDAKHAWAELRGTTGTRFPVTGLALSSDAGLHWTYVNVPKPD